eukprot:TRINITY_DN2275_c0_g3_i1.p1 TRINITY_DN2275_c0_g3~~TRINITY_DN2275_c0_g3_i1.p1  ORF type:complete len:259 (+),score=88.23 TRINITY_DN2275_c0_g3_i1:153-929(+)
MVQANIVLKEEMQDIQDSFSAMNISRDEAFNPVPGMIERSKNTYGDLTGSIPISATFNFKNITNLDEVGELEDIDVCLVNKSKKVVYTAESNQQKTLLHSFILSLIRLEGSDSKDLKAELLKNIASLSAKMDLGINVNGDNSNKQTKKLPPNVKLTGEMINFDELMERKDTLLEDLNLSGDKIKLDQHFLNDDEQYYADDGHGQVPQNLLGNSFEEGREKDGLLHLHLNHMKSSGSFQNSDSPFGVLIRDTRFNLGFN